MSTRAETDLDNCRAVVYTFGPAGRKGSKKCTAACGWYFIPNMVEYPFHDVDALDTKGLVYLTGEQWYAETDCCPNCEPGNSTVKYGWRRNLGQRMRYGGWRKNRGNAYEWFSVESQYSRQDEVIGKCRRQMPTSFSGRSSQKRARMLEVGTRIAGEVGRTPTRREFESDGVLHRNIATVFGNLRNFVIELGLEPRRPGDNKQSSRGRQFVQQYGDEELRKLLRKTFQERGRALSIRKWNEEVGYPRADTIANRLGGGSWSSVCVSVGFEPNSRAFPEGAAEKGWIAQGLNPDEVGKPAYEILNDPDSDYNRMRREVERKVEEHYLPKALEAQERWEQGKFKKGGETHDPRTKA